MSGLPSDRNAPFAGWTPELIDQACAEYESRSHELNAERQAAYAEGRKDERENLERIGALSECPACGGRGERMVTMGEGPHIYQDLEDCPDCKGTGYACVNPDQQYWLARREQIIAALAAEGLQVVSDKDRVWLRRMGGAR